MEYRMNFLLRILTDIFWYIAQILTFETLYLHTEKIGGWTAPQMRIFLGVLFIVDATYMLLFHDNLDMFTQKVRKGDLDLLLMKPVNSQFMMSLQRLSTASIGNLLISAIWLLFSLAHYEAFSWWRLFWLMILVPCGVLIFYSIRFMVSITAILFTRADSLQYLWYQVYRLGMRPDSIYVPWLRITLLSVLPVLAIASVPARALIEPTAPGTVVYAMILCAFFIWLSSRLWKIALTKYTSASS